MKKLPKPKNKYGYTSKELENICKKLKIDTNIFNETFGVNTVMVTKEGKTIYYVCDVLRALYILGHKLGRDIPWD